MSLRMLHKKAGSLAGAMKSAVAAAPARSASYFRKDIKTTADLEGTGGPASDANAGAGASGPVVYSNSVEQMPFPAQKNGNVVPLNWKYLSRAEQQAVFTERLEAAEAAGEALRQIAPRPLVGDAAQIAQRRESISERQALIGADPFRANLAPHMRQSPLWQDVEHSRHRMPRVPLAADAGVDISPTTGLLHLYRLHHAKMFLREEERRLALARAREWVDISAVDVTLEHLPGADNEEMAKIMQYAKHYIGMRAGVSPTERVKLLETVKALLPKVVHVEKVVEVKKRRRRN